MEALVLSNLLNPEYSDLTIICDGVVFPAHKNIVCPQSKYFKAACDGRFKEGDGQIGLDGQDPTLVKKTLEFLYTGNYTYDAPPEDSETEPVSTAEAEASSDNESETSMAHPRTGEPYFHAQMYAQGGYFQIDALQSKAMERFEESFKMLDTFDRDGFTSAVIEVYSSTEENDRGLRRLLVRLTTDNLHRFRGAWSAILDDDFLESIPSFFRDMCFSAVDMCDELQREAMMRGTRI